MAKELRVLSIREETKQGDLAWHTYTSTIKYKTSHLQTIFQDIKSQRVKIIIKKMKPRQVNKEAAKTSNDSDLIFLSSGDTPVILIAEYK